MPVQGNSSAAVPARAVRVLTGTRRGGEAGLAKNDVAQARAAAEDATTAAARARRLLREAARAARRPRAATTVTPPGELRGLVAAHLAAHPGEELGPYVIGRALGRSSGAVANALDRLVGLGQAEMTGEAPRRYRHAGPVPAAAAFAGTAAWTS
jgi:hypothetical protein